MAALFPYHPSGMNSFVLLALVLVAVGLLLVAAAAVLMAVALLRPPRMTDAKAVWVLRRLSPGDLGLAFEDVRFDLRDERGRPLTVRAWWVPHPSAGGRCAVLVHGYADAKVGAIGWAPVWHALGFNLLAIDLRAHGESGGAFCTGGYFERHDLNAALDQLRAQRPNDTRQLVLFGASLGAAVAVAAAVDRTDLAAVVLESPIPDFRRAAMTHMDLLGAPGRWLQRWAVWIAERLSGADFDAVRTTDLIPKVRCAILAILPSDDVFLTPDDAEAIESAIRNRPLSAEPGAVWHVPNVAHLLALHADPAEYRRRLETFLSQPLATHQAASTAVSGL